MKKLLLIRHAEAEGHADKGDLNRPLSVVGKNEAAKLAKKLHAQGLLPQYLITSTALRTNTTAAIITENLQLPQAQNSPAIYEASEKTLLNVINNLPNNYDFIAMVGHNAGLNYLLLNLTGQIRDVHTCTAIVVVFEDADSWQEVSHNTGVITYYTSPQQPN